MGSKQIATVVVLLVVILVALVFVAKKSGIVSGPAVPNRILVKPVEKIDMNSFEVITKEYQEWQDLGQKDGAYKNPATKQYTMVSPIVCAACGAKIPTPPLPPEIQQGDHEARVKWSMDRGGRATWMMTVKCPKCGKNPFGG